MANENTSPTQPTLPSGPAVGAFPQDAERGLELKALWALIHKRSLLVLLMALLMEAVGALYVYRAPRLYEASAQVIINNDDNKILGQDPLAYNLYSEEFFLTQIRRFNSRPVIKRTIKALGMDRWPEYDGVKDLPAFLSTSIQASPIRDSRMVTLSFESPNPEHTALVVSSLVGSFNKEFLRARSKKGEEALTGLAKSNVDLGQEVRDLQKKLNEFIQQRRMFTENRDYNPSFILLREISREQANLQAELTRIQPRVDQIQTPGEGIQKLIGPEDAALERKMEIYDLEILRLEKEMASLENIHSRDSIVILTLTNQIAAVKARKMESIQNYFGGILNHQSQIKKALADTFKRKKALEATVLEQNALLLEYKQLKAQLAQAQTNYQEVLSGENKSRVIELIKFTPAEMSDPPVEPMKPSRPRVLRILALCFLAGIALGIAIAVVQEYVDDSVRSVEDLENYVGINCLALIPRMKESVSVEERMNLVLHKSNAIPAESMRSLRATMDLVTPPQPNACRVFLICSSEAGEGKSTMACNLAISHALNGRRVLLVDGDLRHPTDYSGLIETAYQTAGLSDYLSGQATLEKLCHPTRVPTLEVVTCGQNKANPAEMLGKKRMEEFMRWARLRHEVIILDTPPILAVADALVLSTFADYALLVVKGGEIGRGEVSKSLQILKQSRVKVIGSVLNDIKGTVQKSDGRYYYYTYKYN